MVDETNYGGTVTVSGNIPSCGSDSDRNIAIETRNLERRFGHVRAVANLNLRVPAQSIFGFLGPNGAGKTTTIKMLLGLLRPTGGNASVLGRDIVRDSLWIRSKVGYVMETQAMYGYLTVAETIAFCRGLYPRWDDAIVERFCKAFGLPLERKVGRLSKGMKAQLGLVLALGPDPDLLILDEPTSGLDPVRRHEFLTAVIGEIAETGKTVFFSSHILSEVERVCDYIGIIDRGTLVISGRLDEIKAREKKVRIVTQGELPGEIAGMPEVRKVEREGAGYLISVSGDVDAVVEKLRGLPNSLLEVIDQDLEEIFMDYVGTPVLQGASESRGASEGEGK